MQSALTQALSAGTRHLNKHCDEVTIGHSEPHVEKKNHNLQLKSLK